MIEEGIKFSRLDQTEEIKQLKNIEPQKLRDKYFEEVKNLVKRN